MDPAAAKRFLISKVIDEAAFEHISLTDIEKKMLQFSELHPSLPNLYEVNEEFERDYDADEYEDKIKSLLKNARERDGTAAASVEQEWEDALDALKGEDHYLLVMVHQAFGGSLRSGGTPQSLRIALIIGLLALFLLVGLLRSHHLW
jgi:hypothetical protein